MAAKPLPTRAGRRRKGPMAGSEKDDKPSDQGKKPLGERLRDLVDAIVDELQALLDPPPQPVRVPVSGPRRPR